MSEPSKRRTAEGMKHRLVRRPRRSGSGAKPRRAVTSIILALRTAIVLTAVFVALLFALPLAIAVLAVAFVLRPAAGRVRRAIRAWRASRLLNGDWWHDFERDLKAYTEPSAYRARHRERRL